MTIQSLSGEQVAVLKAQFDLIDQDHDGRITVAELEALLSREAYSHLTVEQRQQLIASYVSVDANGDGGVSFDEYLTLVVSQQKNARDPFREAFDAQDLDHDGYLTAEDFRRISEQQGDFITEQQAAEMIAMADRNHDGKVSFDEYYAIMAASRSE